MQVQFSTWTPGRRPLAGTGRRVSSRVAALPRRRPHGSDPVQIFQSKRSGGRASFVRVEFCGRFWRLERTGNSHAVTPESCRQRAGIFPPGKAAGSVDAGGINGFRMCVPAEKGPAFCTVFLFAGHLLYYPSCKIQR
jgi:hypothetical protein